MSNVQKSSSNLMSGKEEQSFLEFCRKFPNQVVKYHKSSVQEGFEYLFSTGFRDAFGETGVSRRKLLKERFSSGGRSIFKFMLRYGPKIMKGRKRSFRDLAPYLQEIESSTFKKDVTHTTTSNMKLWQELNEYASEKWDIIKIGFTELPTQLIFKDKFVLFRYALVFMQEMQKDKIDTAPLLTAGLEVMRVYATLGEIVNDIARWLRKKGVRCQSNHPLGGLVCTPPLAGKAGMGGHGRNGMLITPEFGPRQRLAPIFIEEKIFNFTDNSDHIWIEEQCKSCDLCQKNCPANAIQEKKRISIDNIPGIGAMRTCIEKEKCFPYFLKTLGCSICIKVCPFSNGEQTYYKLKDSITQKNS
ncbi:MAG: 4Fe-4S binding protein [Promethearchaeota archaeon]